MFRSRPALIAAALDVVSVLVFAGIGRASHGESPLGALLTAWPFLIGLAFGWYAVQQRSHRLPIQVGTGVTVWLITVIIGMLLRAVTGQGTALAFVIVATVVLAALLLGWRAVQERVDILQRRVPAHDEQTAAESPGRG